MKVNLYPIFSSLHNDEVILKMREELFENLKDLTGYEFNIVGLNELYNGDLTIILVESGGSENEFLKNIKYFKEPFYFLTYQSNNSFAASLEILTYLNREHKKGEILHGSNEYLANRIRILMNESLHPDRLGIIGTPSDWLISCNVDKEKCKKVFNIDLVEISTKELEEEIKRHNEDLDPSMFKAEYNYEELKKAYHIYLAILNIVNKYNLKGFTIRCFDLLKSIKSTACLAVALFNDEGIVASCEGDVPALISMFIARKVLRKPTFMANPSILSVSRSELTLAHCTIPLKMCESYKFDTHFESNIGVGIKGELPLGKCNLFRIGPDLDKFVILDGEIIENLNKPNLCRTQVIVKVNDDITYFLKHPLGNHHLIIEGDNKEKLKECLLNLGLKEIK